MPDRHASAKRMAAVCAASEQAALRYGDSCVSLNKRDIREINLATV